MTKDEIRRAVGVQRAGLDAEWVARQSLKVAERVLGMREFGEAETVFLYLAMEGEVSTDRINEACRESGKTVFVPARKGGAYAVCLLEAGMPLGHGPWGVPQPASPAWSSAALVDLAVVPGVAFDATGARLGHGGGYYDRLLAEMPQAFRVGVGFEFQVFETVPTQAHDVGMDALATPARLFSTKLEQQPK